MDFIIYSTYTTKRFKVTNLLLHKLECLYLRIKGIPFEDCLGMYKGIHERSILVYRNTKLSKEDIFKRALLYKQESVLITYSEAERFAYLKFLEYDEAFYLGKLKVLEPSELENLESWTKILRTNLYFGVLR